MATWSDLKQHLNTTGIAFTVDSDRQLSILFEFADGRRQKVVVELQTVGDVAWCLITTRIGTGDAVSPEDVLAATSKVVPGGLCLFAGEYFLRQSLALKHLDGDAFVFYLRQLAGRGDALEQSLFNAADDN